MKKKIKLIFITIFLSIIAIASIMEIGKILNIAENNVEYTDLSKMEANASHLRVSSVVFGADSFVVGNITSGAETDHMYDFIPKFKTGYAYCAGHGWALTIKAEYKSDSTNVPDIGSIGRKQVVRYVKSELHKEVSQSVVYAIMSGNYSQAQIQDLVWDSGTWANFTNGSGIIDRGNVTISGEKEKRANRFANFIYNILGNDEKLNIKLTTPKKADDLKVIVKQDKKSYTVGPYNLTFSNYGETATGESITYGDIVYNEIARNYGNPQNDAFCVGELKVKIVYEDGSTKTVKGTDTMKKDKDKLKLTIVGTDDKKISSNCNFPKFGQDFLIRYNLDDDEVDKPIKEIIPTIKVDYLKKLDKGFHVNGGKSKGAFMSWTYEAKEIEFEMAQDRADLLKQLLKYYKVIDYKGKKLIYPEDQDSWTFWKHWVLGETENINVVLKNYSDLMAERIRFALNKHMSGWNLNIESNEDITVKYNSGVYLDEKFNDEGLSLFIKDMPDPNEQENQGGTGSGETQEPKIYRKYAYIPALPHGDDEDPWQGYYGYYEDENEKTAILEAKKNLGEALANVKLCMEITGLTVRGKVTMIQPCILIELMGYELDWIHLRPKFDDDYGSESITLPSKKINMYIGGNVWEDMPSTKLGEYTGKKDKKSLSLAGVQVELWDVNLDDQICVTTTDKDGEYGFQKLNPMHKYYIKFFYDGMRFEPTKYENNLAGGYSTAKETKAEREAFNRKFSSISATPNNYAGDRRAYRSVH